MIDKDLIVKVTNRDNGSVGYSISDYGVGFHRRFSSGETKEVPADELLKLSYQPGGMQILRDYLVIDNEELVRELFNEVEPEYFYSEEDVKNLLDNGTRDQLEDCLNFGPAGTIELIKKYAVDSKLNDVAKRQLILEKTGFNVTKAIEIVEADKEDVQPTEKVRKAAPITKAAAATPTRKTSGITTEKRYVVKK